jgi:outer membrane lipoprotein carrier protein
MRKGSVSRRLTLGAAVTLAAGALLLASGRPERAAAQEQPDAATVAAWVQAFYDQTTTMSARFVQRYVNRVYQRTDVSRGRVRFEKPGKMRFDYDEPNGKVLVSDGQRLTVYEPPDPGQQRGQYYQQPIEDAQLPAALSFLTGTGRLDEDFTFRLLDAEALGYGEGQVLELRSRRPTPHYSRILLYVDDDPQRRGVVHRVLIIDQSQNRNRFDFLEQRFNRSIPDSVFRYRPPRGARRIQP